MKYWPLNLPCFHSTSLAFQIVYLHLAGLSKGRGDGRRRETEEGFSFFFFSLSSLHLPSHFTFEKPDWLKPTLRVSASRASPSLARSIQNRYDPFANFPCFVWPSAFKRLTAYIYRSVQRRMDSGSHLWDEDIFELEEVLAYGIKEGKAYILIRSSNAWELALSQHWGSLHCKCVWQLNRKDYNLLLY